MYTIGYIGKYNVVISFLSKMEKVNATEAAAAFDLIQL